MSPDVYKSTQVVPLNVHASTGRYSTFATNRSRSAASSWNVFWKPPVTENSSLSSATQRYHVATLRSVPLFCSGNGSGRKPALAPMLFPPDVRWFHSMPSSTPNSGIWFCRNRPTSNRSGAKRFPPQV